MTKKIPSVQIRMLKKCWKVGSELSINCNNKSPQIETLFPEKICRIYRLDSNDLLTNKYS